MLTRSRLLSLALFATLTGLLGTALVQAAGRAKVSQAAYTDIQATLGRVPQFFREVPETAISGAWEEMKAVQLAPDTAIPPKYKELIGLAVASQIPCRYCVYFHTEVAQANGGTQQEVREAVMMAALTRHWSTFLNGMQVDDKSFRKEVRQALDHVKNARPTGKPIEVRDAASAYADMERTFGLVPGFFKLFPKAGIAGAWREYKAVELDPKSAIPPKYKELIGLAVAAQVPCSYCTFFHTEVARATGATDAEIAEAVALASIVRHWSTFLNGMQIDEARFRKDVDGVLRDAKKRAAAR